MPALAHLPTLGLDDQGIIRRCCPGSEELFGYPADQLEGLHISALAPQLNDSLVQDERINSRLAYLCRCAFAFQMQHRDGRKFLSQLFINRLGAQNVVVLVRRLDAQ